MGELIKKVELRVFKRCIKFDNIYGYFKVIVYCLNCWFVEGSNSWKWKLIIIGIRFVKCCWVGVWIVLNVILVVMFWSFWFLWNFGLWINVEGFGILILDFDIVSGGRKEFILVIYGDSKEKK